MIIDSMSNAYRYADMHPAFKKAFEYVKSLDLTKLEAGKTQLDGKNLVVNVSNINPKSDTEARMETHKDFIDIQIPVTAEETMGWTPLEKLQEITTAYNPEKDVTFYADKAENFIKVKPGEFCIFFPGDGHQPGITPVAATKIIVKVRM